MKQRMWLGHQIDENGIILNEEKVEAILKLKPPNNTKELKSFLDSIQHLTVSGKFPTEKTDKIGKLLRKNEP